MRVSPSNLRQNALVNKVVLGRKEVETSLSDKIEWEKFLKIKEIMDSYYKTHPKAIRTSPSTILLKSIRRSKLR